MVKRLLFMVFAALVVGGIAAAVWFNLPVTRTESQLDDVPTSTAPVASNDRFAELVRTDPLAAFQASVAAYPRTGFTAEFRKRERMGGKLAEEEVIRVSVQDDPYSVLMIWQQGGGAGQGTLYVKGQNAGKMKVWMFRKLIQDIDPQGFVPKQSARYTIEEFGIEQSTKRTLRAWAAAKEAGELQFEYLGRKAVPEAGGRECFVLKRTSSTDTIDPFVTGGPAVAVTDKNRKDSFRTVTVYLDCETRLQVGTEQHRHDGELTASYWFRDVNLKPNFDTDTFTTKSFQ
ncbi:MAG: DUF1571 domain-containing protein [Fimbriiglobus sp.]|nr:DUF1571 domain-containing protein [Fimbriiglobus sp.]